MLFIFTNIYFRIKVETPTKQIQTLKTNTVRLRPGENGILSYEDSMIKIDWFPTFSQFGFTMKNKSNSTLKLNWDNSVYVDQYGSSHKIINSTTKLIESEESIVSTPITRGGILEDIIYPADFAYYVSGRSGGWRTPDLFKSIVFNEKQFIKLQNEFLNKDIKILLSLESQNQTKEYLFTFKITDINYVTENN